MNSMTWKTNDLPCGIEGLSKEGLIGTSSREKKKKREKGEKV